MLKCKSCGAAVDLTMTACPACGAELQMSRLTGVLGIVCRHCDAYNEPNSKSCASCGQPLGTLPTPTSLPASVGPADTSPSPAAPISVVRPDALGSASPAEPVASALQPGRAKLMLERGEGFDGAVYRLNSAQVAMGRARGSIVFPSDNTLAAHHATFFYRDGSLLLRDEGSPGGVFVKLRDLSAPLKLGDLFIAGDRLLRFAGPLAPPPPPPPDGVRRFGSPRPAGVAVLVEEWLEGGVGGRVYLRPAPSVTIGRSGCSINIADDPYLSQAHAEIAVAPDGSAKLRDLGSSNGTFVRVPSRSERMLRDGDVLRMGREVLRVIAS